MRGKSNKSRGLGNRYQLVGVKHNKVIIDRNGRRTVVKKSVITLREKGATMKTKTCGCCGHSMETFTALPEDGNGSDIFEWEPCIKCKKGCRLIVTINGQQRFYECCHCTPPFGNR